MEKIKKVFTLSLLSAPLLVFAEGNNVSNIQDFFATGGPFMAVLNLLIKVLIGIAVVLFLYGIIKYVSSGDDEAKRKEAKNYIVYGIVVLFVMVSVWGLVGILSGSFRFSSSVIPVPSARPGEMQL